jgi:LEA14-like dessication related protein
VEIVEVSLVSLGLSSGTASVALDLTNSSSRELTVRGFRYELEVLEALDEGPNRGNGWTRLAGGFYAEELQVPGKATERLVIPVPFEYRALGAALRSFLARGEVPFRLSGEVAVRSWGMTVQVPFRTQGALGSGRPGV